MWPGLLGERRVVGGQGRGAVPALLLTCCVLFPYLSFICQMRVVPSTQDILGSSYGWSSFQAKGNFRHGE